jgi:hypothetical protein
MVSKDTEASIGWCIDRGGGVIGERFVSLILERVGRSFEEMLRSVSGF